MQARMKNPVAILPDAAQAVQGLIKAAGKGGVPQETLELVHLRASQINGCSACVHGGSHSAHASTPPSRSPRAPPGAEFLSGFR